MTDTMRSDQITDEAKARLKTVVDRLERIETERDQIISDIRDIYASVSQVETTTMEWRVCVGCPRYEVSEYGDVRIAENGKRLKGSIDCDGYLRYGLVFSDGVKRSPGAHVLVAEAFIGERPSSAHQVAHRNGSRTANHRSNLRWATPVQNIQDKIVHGTSSRGSNNPKARLTEEDVRAIRIEYREIKAGLRRGTIGELAGRYGVAHASLCNIANGKSWKHVPMPPRDDLYAESAAA